MNLKTQSREEKAETKRQLILEEALTVFAEKGYHGANIADIAQRLGMGHGTFYRYFLNKHDLFVGVLDVAEPRPDLTAAYAERIAAFRRLYQATKAAR